MRIELPDDVGAALEARAAAQGLSLEKWFQKLAEQQPAELVYSLSEPIERSENEHRSVVERMRELRAHVKPDPEGWTTRDYINYGRR